MEWTGTQSFRWYGCSDIQRVCFPALGFEVRVKKNDIDRVDTKTGHSILGTVHMRKTHLLLQRTLAKDLNLPLEWTPAAHTTLLSCNLKLNPASVYHSFRYQLYFYLVWKKNKILGPAFNDCTVLWSWRWTKNMQSPQGEGKVHAVLFYILGQSQQICRLENTEDYLKKVLFSLSKSK